MNRISFFIGFVFLGLTSALVYIRIHPPVNPSGKRTKLAPAHRIEAAPQPGGEVKGLSVIGDASSAPVRSIKSEVTEENSITPLSSADLTQIEDDLLQEAMRAGVGQTLDPSAKAEARARLAAVLFTRVRAALGEEGAFEYFTSNLSAGILSREKTESYDGMGNITFGITHGSFDTDAAKRADALMVDALLFPSSRKEADLPLGPPLSKDDSEAVSGLMPAIHYWLADQRLIVIQHAAGATGVFEDGNSVYADELALDPEERSHVGFIALGGIVDIIATVGAKGTNGVRIYATPGSLVAFNPYNVTPDERLLLAASPIGAYLLKVKPYLWKY